MPSSPNDFDFMFGHYKIAHRRLRQRLKGFDDWQEFSGESNTVPILGGMGNVEDNLLHLPQGSYRATAIRSSDANLGLWSIWWLDGRKPHHIETPVIGGFDQGVGSFFASVQFEGKPAQMRFIWRPNAPDGPIWEQALSPDAGESWETNWVMRFSR
jgi:hypothetical protein